MLETHPNSFANDSIPCQLLSDCDWDNMPPESISTTSMLILAFFFLLTSFLHLTYLSRHLSHMKFDKKGGSFSISIFNASLMSLACLDFSKGK